jgi:branched-chain amino acid aminotransferase
MPERAPYVWWNGRLTRWDDARVHATMLGWSTMGAVFEGIKAYWHAPEAELYALQFEEHYDRFLDSMRLQRMSRRWSARQLIEASVELLRANEVSQDAYVRPIA